MIQITKYFIIPLAALAAVFYISSCDDSGLLPTEVRAGQIVFEQVNKFPTLNPANDGLYNLWIVLADTGGIPRALSLGQFNVLSNGGLVNGNGNPVELEMNASDTVDLERAIYAFVTIEQGIVGVPGNTRLIAGPFSVYGDSVSSRLLFTDTAALGSVGASLLAPNAVFYHINTPTGTSGDCVKGIWFADLGGVASWPTGSVLNPGSGWKYRGWLRNKITGVSYDMGTFYKADQQDSDGAGVCAGTTGMAYETPGEDYVQIGCSDILSISDGSHEVFGVLEPEGRQNNLPPFVLKIYYQSNIVPTLGCNRRDNMFTQRTLIPMSGFG